MMTKPIVEYDSIGPSGNIYAILALCKEVLPEDSFNRMKEDVFESHGYDDALGIIENYVVLVDYPGREGGC